MASNFSSLRSSRSQQLAKLNEAIKSESQKSGADERFWKLTVDQKTKIGYAKLRFLPAPEGEDVPWVRLYNHAFQIGGSWFIENCPTTIGLECPICQSNNKYWNSGIESDKDISRKRKRQLKFISNVKVLEDASHPEHVGKEMLFKYGSKIHDKIKDLGNPEFPDQTPCNPFDLWEGADFKLKSAEVGGFQNYDKSSFADPTAACGGDEAKMEEVWSKEYKLQPFIAADQFKAYDELEKRFNKVLSGSASKHTAEAAMKDEEPTVADVQEAAVAVADKPKRTRPTQRPAAANPTNAKAAEKPAAPATEGEASPESEEDIRAFFSGVLSD